MYDLRSFEQLYFDTRTTAQGVLVQQLVAGSIELQSGTNRDPSSITIKVTAALTNPIREVIHVALTVSHPATTEESGSFQADSLVTRLKREGDDWFVVGKPAEGEQLPPHVLHRAKISLSYLQRTA